MTKKRNLMGKVRKFSPERAKRINDVVFKILYGKHGRFSGTSRCECGGEVKYSCKRNDGAELGGCVECGEIYIDSNGNRLPSVYDFKILI